MAIQSYAMNVNISVSPKTMGDSPIHDKCRELCDKYMIQMYKTHSAYHFRHLLVFRFVAKQRPFPLFYYTPPQEAIENITKKEPNQAILAVIDHINQLSLSEQLEIIKQTPKIIDMLINPDKELIELSQLYVAAQKL